MDPVLMVALGWLLISAGSASAENWPRFRGQNGLGVGNEQGIPGTWSPGDYAFNVELPGVGHSSPAIWDDRLFVSSAIEEGTIRYLLCLNAATGKEVWSRETGFNKSTKHLKSSWASASPTTDGERVYVAFADKERYMLAAYDMDGELVWRRSIGPFQSRHGQGASPIVYGDLVIAVNDQIGPSTVVALDRYTGKTVWSTLRQSQQTSYASPLIATHEGEAPQLICSCGAMGVTSLNPLTGRMNWMTGQFPARTVGSPTFTEGLIIQTCGGGGIGKHMVAVDPFHAKGEPGGRIRYVRERTLPYVPTPIGYQGHLYLWNDNGVVSCVRTRDGKNIWTKRVGGTYSSSPICVDGKLFIIGEDGEVVVVAASPEYKLFGRVPLDDPSHSTPAVANGRLYLRTFHRLACLEANR